MDLINTPGLAVEKIELYSSSCEKSEVATEELLFCIAKSGK